MKFELVEEWRSAWRWASVQLAVVAGALATAAIAAWPVLHWLIMQYVPDGPVRSVVAAFVGVIVFAVPVATRIFKKKPCPPTSAEPGKPHKEVQPPLGKSGLAAIMGSLAAGLAITTVALWEGKSNDPYRDIVGVRTVCYGETKVEMRRYSDAECAEMLAVSLGGYASAVLKRNPNLRDRPYQLAAATSLAYNIGAAAYSGSTVARRFQARDWRGGCDAFLMWNKAGGRVVKGLDRRRREERRICLTDVG
jgi:lysozyme